MKKKTTEEKFSQLNYEYQLLIVRRQMIQDEIAAKEREIQKLLAEEAGITIYLAQDA
jgi:hypothetical protein